MNLSNITAIVKTSASLLRRVVEYVKWWVSSFWAAVVLLGIWAGITLTYAFVIIAAVHFIVGMFK